MVNKKRLTVTVDKELLDELNMIIKENGIKMSFAISMLVKDFVELYKGKEIEK